MHYKLLAIAFSLAFTAATSQPMEGPLSPNGGGPYAVHPADEFTEPQRQAMQRMVQQSLQQLEKEGRLAAALPQHTSFIWPIRWKPGIIPAADASNMGAVGISNYIDQNTAFPNQILDYNCGNRSYDLAGGYNHLGTDIFSWPFPWYKMRYNQVQIVAAAAGTILVKIDNQPDENCSFCSGPCDWNAVYVRHADGSIAFYGHLKKGSLTSKAVGATVQAGDYLGVMGSSGNSTGPHLHFEVWENSNFNKLIDPWAGPCNALNGNTSWWASQQPYRVSTLNGMLTHNQPPQQPGCVGGEAVNEARRFSPGQLIYLSTYYRDQLAGQTVTHRIYQPNNVLWNQWNQTFADTYSASWWWYSWYLPANALTGIWRYEVEYNGGIFTTRFAVNQNMVYTFTGNGSYFTAANWQNNQPPPNPIPAGVEVNIQPAGTGECVIDGGVVVLNGGQFRVSSGKQVKLLHNVINE